MDNENKFKKKGQISIFVIVGVILIIVTVFLLYNSDIEIFQSHDTKMKNQLSQIVKDCIYNDADLGTFLLGQQGGYIQIPQTVKLNPTKYTDFGTKIPNWDSTRGDIPTINSMEYELKNYIEEKSYACINSNLKAMENAFDIRTGEKLIVKANINDENIIIEASYPITFNEKNSDQILNIEDYVVRLDNLRLGDMYKLAAEIYNVESNTYIYEELLLDQIHSANDYSSPNSVPTEGMDISCGKRIWTIPQLKKNIAMLNNNNFKYLQFEGTYSKDYLFKANLDYSEETKALKPYFENIYTVKLNQPKKSFTNYEVETFMPSTEITNKEGIFQRYPYRTFEVTPSSGQLVKSVQMKMDFGAIKLPMPCIQLYHHLYTLDYDLIVKLTDKNEDGNSFVFQFPVRVEIKDGQPKTKSITQIVTELDTFTQDNYCTDQNMKYPLLVLTTDLEDNPVNGVNISYKCISVECDMGSTAKPTFQGIERKYATPQLETEFPFCIGGYVIAQKDGYHIFKQRVTTDESLLRREAYIGDNLVEAKMIPLKSFSIDSPENFLIKLKETGTGKRVLTKDDGAILVSIENKGYEFESNAIWPNEGYLNKLEFLDLDDVVYNLTVYYTDSDYKLKGLLQIENWNPNIHAGNKIQFLIPGTNQEVNENNFLTFYDHVEKVSKTADYQPRFY